MGVRYGVRAGRRSIVILAGRCLYTAEPCISSLNSEALMALYFSTQFLHMKLHVIACLCMTGDMYFRN
jgi:hypothetical protein